MDLFTSIKHSLPQVAPLMLPCIRTYKYQTYFCWTHILVITDGRHVQLVESILFNRLLIQFVQQKSPVWYCLLSMYRFLILNFFQGRGRIFALPDPPKLLGPYAWVHARLLGQRHQQADAVISRHEGQWNIFTQRHHQSVPGTICLLQKAECLKASLVISFFFILCLYPTTIVLSLCFLLHCFSD